MASATLLSTPTKLRIPTMAPTPMGMLRCTDSTAIPLKVECSSRPQKKATAHHVKSRPKKHQPYDKNRQGPTLYPDQIFPLRRAPYLSMALMPKKFRKAYNAYVAENPLVEDDRYPFKQQEERNPRRQQEVEEDGEESAPAAVLPAEIVEDDSAPVVVAEDA